MDADERERLNGLVAEAAERFHEAFWMPWRSGRAIVMCADEVAEAYGELRAALARRRELGPITPADARPP